MTCMALHASSLEDLKKKGPTWGLYTSKSEHSDWIYFVNILSMINIGI